MLQRSLSSMASVVVAREICVEIRPFLHNEEAYSNSILSQPWTLLITCRAFFFLHSP